MMDSSSVAVNEENRSTRNDTGIPSTFPQPQIPVHGNIVKAVEAATQDKMSGFPPFPQPGSLLGPYFCLGQLGSGTFCSIHRCVNLDYSKDESRLVVAKVELETFSHSGVLDVEAYILKLLSENLPPKSVPMYMGHLKSDGSSAIIMEYLRGEDMHQLRERSNRRMSVKDSVYLTAHVMLPILKSMHRVGVVHRDVKPSNCVRCRGKKFCMVDFGLSKSVVVPADAALSDPAHPWPSDQVWSPVSGALGCWRKERETAEFRGTSMYASLRVHQLKDYCPRDDMWSLLYVFCDLVSGGLPWMSYASNRDREACQRFKERVHGEGPQKRVETELLLMGAEYHVSNYRREEEKRSGKDENSLTKVAEPLSLSGNKKNVQALSEVFAHLAGLEFTDIPDYDLIKRALEIFLEHGSENDAKPIEWERLDKEHDSNDENNFPLWKLLDDPDMMEEHFLEEADRKREPPKADSFEMGRLPIAIQLMFSQMHYNSQIEIAPHLELRDWIKCASFLINGKWDWYKYEKGNYRSDNDPYRRELYLKLVRKCLECAKSFQNPQKMRECFYHQDKKRRVESTFMGETIMVPLSDLLVKLRRAELEEMQKRFAPPPSIKLGSNTEVSP